MTDTIDWKERAERAERERVSYREALADAAIEADRLRARVAELEAAMPTEEERAALLDLRIATMHLIDEGIVGEWFIRLDAARGGSNG